MKTAHVFVAVMGVAFAASVSAQQMKPGLWEITSNMKSSSGEMEKQMAAAQAQMANMPPEQRRMMEEAMAKQGVKMGARGPGGTTSQMCMTKEMVERNETPAPRGDCTTTKNERSGSTIRVAYQCKDGTRGEGEYTVVSPESYRMKSSVQMAAQGKPETMTMEGSGKWLGADCGSLKPLARPPGK